MAVILVHCRYLRLAWLWRVYCMWVVLLVINILLVTRCLLTGHVLVLTYNCVCVVLLCTNVFQDGTIQLEMKLTGILSTSVMDLNSKASQHGIAVAPGGDENLHLGWGCLNRGWGQGVKLPFVVC